MLGLAVLLMLTKRPITLLAACNSTHYTSNLRDAHLMFASLKHAGGDWWVAGGTVEERKNALEWATRAKIALGIGRALSYLHHGCEPRIVHRDVSATNVLLDKDYEPRLSDFGLATLMYNNDTHVTVTVGGTFGYVAPGTLQLGSRRLVDISCEVSP